MKKLLSTTALALALGLPSLSLAQATSPAAEPAAQSQAADNYVFLSSREQSDLLASELLGHEVYARRMPAETASTEGQPGMMTDGNHGMVSMTRADLNEMENIGKINEIVLSSDGQVRGIVIGVGGFLGVGEMDVAVAMDQVTFAFDPEDRSQTYVTVNIGVDMLEESPAYDRTVMTDDSSAERADAPAADRTAFTRPEVDRDGFDRVEATRVSTDMLIDATVYDVDDNSVGTVDKLVVDDGGAITNVIIDFGGFLGMGSTQISLAYEELTILSNDDNTEVRIYVDATKDQIQALPQYQEMN